MTRTADINLCYGKYSKDEDMRVRQTIINNSDANLAISIHQNSYTTERVRGAQVFCYKGSEEGIKAGNIVTEELEKEFFTHSSSLNVSFISCIDAMEHIFFSSIIYRMTSIS